MGGGPGEASKSYFLLLHPTVVLSISIRGVLVHPPGLNSLLFSRSCECETIALVQIVLVLSIPSLYSFQILKKPFLLKSLKKERDQTVFCDKL